MLKKHILSRYLFSIVVLLFLISCRHKVNKPRIIINKPKDKLVDLVKTNDSFIIVTTGNKTCTYQFEKTFCPLYDSLSKNRAMLIVVTDSSCFDCMRNKYNNTFIYLNADEKKLRRQFNVFYSFSFYYKKQRFQQLVIDFE